MHVKHMPEAAALKTYTIVVLSKVIWKKKNEIQRLPPSGYSRNWATVILIGYLHSSQSLAYAVFAITKLFVTGISYTASMGQAIF